MKVAIALSLIEAGLLWALACVLPAQAAPASVAPAVPARDVRAEEIASCRPDEIKTWGDGRDAPAASP